MAEGHPAPPKSEGKERLFLGGGGGRKERQRLEGCNVSTEREGKADEKERARGSTLSRHSLKGMKSAERGGKTGFNKA